MRRIKFIALVLALILVAGASVAWDCRPQFPNKELQPVYLCIGEQWGVTVVRFAKWKDKDKDGVKEPVCRPNETMMEAFVLVEIED